MNDTWTLECLLAIAEEKSISKAANRLYCAQPTLSRQLQNVEKKLGTKLFIRTHGHLVLTDSGKIYINNAKAILYTERKLKQDLAALRKERKETVRLLIDPYFYFFTSRRIIPAFEQKYPEYELMISEGSAAVAIEAVKNDMVDISFLISGEQHDEALDYRMLFYDEYVFIAPRTMVNSQEALQFSRCGPVAFQEYCFILERNDNIFRTLQGNILKYYNFHPNLVYEVSDPTTALQMVVNGNGVSLTSRARIQAYAQELLILPIKPAFSSSLYAAYRKEMLLQLPAKCLLDVLTDQTRSFNEYMLERHG